MTTETSAPAEAAGASAAAGAAGVGRIVEGLTKTAHRRVQSYLDSSGDSPRPVDPYSLRRKAHGRISSRRCRPSGSCRSCQDVFVSYSSGDKPTADAVCATLERKGIRCWMAPRDILPGVDWGGAIVDAINASTVMVLVYSARANDSPQIKREVERAVHRGLPIIPFRIEDVPMSKTLEYFMSMPHWLDALTPPLQDHLDRLAETTRLILEKVSAAVLPGSRVKFSGYDEPRYRAALQLHLGDLPARAACGGVLADWPGRPAGVDAAHLRLFLEPWATVQSGQRVEFQQEAR